MCSITTDDASRSVYRSTGQAIGHVAKMMDAADRLLRHHPGHAVGVTPYADLLRSVRAAERQAA
jgi:hypothetical protein